MADACKFIEASEPALNWPSGSFKRAFAANRRDAAAQSLEKAERLLPALEDLLSDCGGRWSGTATDLLGKINPNREPELPRSPNSLSAEIGRLDSSLREFGVEATFHRQGHASTKTIALKLTQTSPEAPASTADQENWSTQEYPDSISGTPAAVSVEAAL